MWLFSCILAKIIKEYIIWNNELELIKMFGLVLNLFSMAIGFVYGSFKKQIYYYY
jgi:hypothetical protein